MSPLGSGLHPKCGSLSIVFAAQNTNLELSGQDVDVVVFNQRANAENVKDYLVSVNDRFYLVDSTNPRNTYKILYYSISRRPSLGCKVDILTPGPEVLHIPRITDDHVLYLDGSDIPVMPFLPLLILKVQGWYDHRRSHRQDMRQKVPHDVNNIMELLDMTDKSDRLNHFNWLPDWFIERAYTIIRDFCKKKPSSRSSWRSLGFDV